MKNSSVSWFNQQFAPCSTIKQKSGLKYFLNECATLSPTYWRKLKEPLEARNSFLFIIPCRVEGLCMSGIKAFSSEIALVMSKWPCQVDRHLVDLLSKNMYTATHKQVTTRAPSRKLNDENTSYVNTERGNKSCNFAVLPAKNLNKVKKQRRSGS